MSVLRYFDPRADTTIQTDASQKKGWEMPSYKTSSQYATFQGHLAEQNYNNIERETLAWGVVWELENFHHFIYGKHYFLHTDH